MYTRLEEMLTGMLPGFTQLYGKTLPPTLQVVVKVQRYRMPPRATYTGRWHTEGVCENVSMVGVYYAEWPELLEGGELKFRPTDVPDDNFRFYLSSKKKKETFVVSLVVPGGGVGHHLPQRSPSPI